MCNCPFFLGLWCTTPPIFKSKWISTIQHPTECRQENGKHFVKYWQRRFVGGMCPWCLSKLDLTFLLNWKKGLMLSARDTYSIWLINLPLLWTTLSFCAGVAECWGWVLTDTRTYVHTNLRWGPGSQGIIRHQATVTRSRWPGFCWIALFPPEGSLSYNWSVWFHDVLKVLCDH